MNKIKAFFSAIISFFIRHFGPAVGRIRMQHPRNQLYPFLVVMVLLIVLFFTAFAGPSSTRRVFFFPDVRSGAVRTEVRYLQKNPQKDENFQYYIRELLLGPINPLSLALFNRPVHPNSVFVRDNVAYIDLPVSVLVPEAGVAATQKGYQFFLKNVFANFRNIDKIYLYIDGIEVYGGEPLVEHPAGL